MFDEKIIGQKIAYCREGKKISRAGFADVMMVSVQAVGKWERGESLPDIITMKKIADFFGVSVDYFFNADFGAGVSNEYNRKIAQLDGISEEVGNSDEGEIYIMDGKSVQFIQSTQSISNDFSSNGFNDNDLDNDLDDDLDDLDDLGGLGDLVKADDFATEKLKNGQAENNNPQMGKMGSMHTNDDMGDYSQNQPHNAFGGHMGKENTFDYQNPNGDCKMCKASINNCIKCEKLSECVDDNDNNVNTQNHEYQNQESLNEEGQKGDTHKEESAFKQTLNNVSSVVTNASNTVSSAVTNASNAVWKTMWNMSGTVWRDGDFSRLSNIADKFKCSNILNCNFSDSDISSIAFKCNNVKNSNFSGANLSGSRLVMCSLFNNNFSDATFEGAIFKMCDTRGSNFSKADFSGAEILHTTFSKNNLNSTVFSGTKVNFSRFDSVEVGGCISDCSFTNSEFKNSTFKDVVFLNTFFKNHKIKNCKFINCKADRMTYSFLKNCRADLLGIECMED